MLAGYKDRKVKLNELAKQYDITKQTIRKYVKESGESLRYKVRGRYVKITREEGDRIMRLREIGMSNRQIAKTVGRAETSVGRVIKARNLELAKLKQPTMWERIKGLFTG